METTASQEKKALLGFDASLDLPRISYHKNGSGRWHRIVWKRQCPEGVLFQGRCQGTEGHKGVHWRYLCDGGFWYEDNKQDSTEAGCAGCIPPRNIRYCSPEQMADQLHRNFSEESEVTDPHEIARLEQGRTVPGESITRPATIEEAARIQKRETHDSSHG